MFSFNDDDYVTEYRPRKHGGPSNTVLILLIVLLVKRFFNRLFNLRIERLMAIG